MSIIDSLTEGFKRVYRHWWVLLIPILLDAFLWIGPRASIEYLMEETVQTLKTDSGDFGASEEMVEVWSVIDATLTEVIPHYNSFSTLRVSALGVPSLLVWGGARFGVPSRYEVLWVFFLLGIDMDEMLISVTEATFVDSSVWQLPNGVAWLLSALALTVVGILIGSVYMTSISYSLDQTGAFWPRLLRFGIRFALFGVLRIVMGIVMGIPVWIVTLALGALNPSLAYLFSTIVLGLLAWLSFYGIFFIAALAVNNASLWRAIWNSFNIVMRNFWPTLGLFLLINLIGGGLTILWQQLSTGSWLTLVGIVGNAYVGTSLVTASLVFYLDRYARWQELVAELLRQSKQLT